MELVHAAATHNTGTRQGMGKHSGVRSNQGDPANTKGDVDVRRAAVVLCCGDSLQNTCAVNLHRARGRIRANYCRCSGPSVPYGHHTGNHAGAHSLGAYLWRRLMRRVGANASRPPPPPHTFPTTHTHRVIAPLFVTRPHSIQSPYYVECRRRDSTRCCVSRVSRGRR